MLNQIAIQGRLTKTPELRHTQAGKPVASFPIACDRDFKDSNGNKATDFFDIVVWGQTGERCADWLSKGQLVTLTGRLQTRDWTDRNGNKRKAFEIVANNVYFPPKTDKDQEIRTQFEAPTEPQFEDLDEGDGDLPF